MEVCQNSFIVPLDIWLMPVNTDVLFCLNQNLTVPMESYALVMLGILDTLDFGFVLVNYGAVLPG